MTFSVKSIVGVYIVRYKRQGMKFYFKMLGREHEYVVSDSFVLGRREGALILDEDNKISGRHLRFYKKADCFYVEDLASSNGTWLNDVQLPKNQPALLKEGDVVKCGRQTLSIYIENAISLNRENDDDPDKTKIEIPAIAEEMFPEHSSKIETEPNRSLTLSKVNKSVTVTKASSIGKVGMSSQKPFRLLSSRIVLSGILISLAAYYFWETSLSKAPNFKPQVPLVKKDLRLPRKIASTPVETKILTRLSPKLETKSKSTQKAFRKSAQKVPEKSKLIANKRPIKTEKAKSALRIHTENLRAKYKKAPTLGSRQAIIFQAKEFAENYYAAERRKIVKNFKTMRYPASQFLNKKEETERKLEAMRNREQRFMDMLPGFFKGASYTE